MSDAELTGEAPNGRDLVLSIITTIAEREGTDPTHLTPLEESIDADAVKTVIESADDSVTLRFTHLGHEVAIYGDGTVHVDSPRQQEAAVEA